jgi:S1-C subfamily serine protease
LTELAENKTQAAIETAEARKAALQARVDELHARLTALAETSTDLAKERVDQLVERSQELRDNAIDRVDDTADTARERLGRVREGVRALRSDLRQAASELKSDAAESLRDVRAKTAALAYELNGYVSDQLANVQETVDTAIEKARVDIDLTQRNRLGFTVAAADNVITVATVTEGTFAAEAGLRSGDEVIAVNGVPVTTPKALFGELRTRASAEEQVEIQIRREGKTQTLKADLSGVADSLITSATRLPK